MGTHSDAAKLETLARLKRSRAEIQRVLEPPPRVSHEGRDAAFEEGDPDRPNDTFPRSRTMRMLMSARGIGTVGAILGAIFVARPTLMLKIVRVFPAGAVGRFLLVKAVSALRSRL
jgi:hypothetical protein